MLSNGQQYILLTKNPIRIWIIYFIDSIQQGMSNSLLPYVTSSFSQHSLTATTSIMSSIIGGLCKLPLAKVLDIWGRHHGLAAMTFVLTVGLIMMAACNNVRSYAAAQVFYWVGYNGLTYTLGIFIADTSSLKNRSFMFAYATSPYIVTTWIGGPLATIFLNGPGWRWGYGAFAIITPVVISPLIMLFAYNVHKAERIGLIKGTNKANRTFGQSVKYYLVEFDAFGLLLVIAGLTFFLLPFNLYSYQRDGWKSPLILSMLIVGLVFLAAFIMYEKYLAPITFMPYELLTDRTVLGACVLATVLFVSYYIWNSYFGSFLQVVNGLDITKASYIQNVYSIGSCFWALIVGILIRWTGRFKWLAMYFGVPMTILGVGLMIVFRQPDVNIGYVVMCQVFIAFAGGTLVICEQMAVMAATTHQYVAVVLAVEAMFSAIGGAIGATVAAAVWTGVFPEKLAEYLPEEDLPDLNKIYGDLSKQLSYPIGSATRTAIMKAYSAAQRDMLIGATAILGLAVVSVMMWRDIDVRSFKQVKGNVV